MARFEQSGQFIIQVVLFKSTMPMVVGSHLVLAPCIFIIVTASTFQFVEPVFIYFFSKLSQLLL